MFRTILLFTTIFLLYSTTASTQAINYKKYVDSTHGFSLDIPAYWTIQYSKKQEGIVCIPVTKEQKAIFRDCFEGIVFRIEFFKTGLEATLSDEGYSKVGNTYYTTDRVSDHVKTDNIKGSNWTGIYHNNVCGISCTGNGFHAAAGQCQFLFMSNGKRTICISTNGRAFDGSILKNIISSFRFTAG